VLRELHIAGLGVIEDLDLELDPGLNVLTGETGAGKTMVTVGLALALGRRASATLVRPGAKAAHVQARFDAPDRADVAAWVEDGEIVLARTVSSDGRSSARIGGQLAPVSALAQLAPALVEVHGQHDGTTLLSPLAQTAFLDRSIGEEHLGLVGDLAAEHEAARVTRAELARLEERGRDREREMDLLAYQVREIEAASPCAGEIAELEVEEARLAHAERLMAHATGAQDALAVDGGAIDLLATAAAELRAAADVDAAVDPVAETAASLAAAAGELARDARAYREALELDPARLDEIRERLGVLRSLRRKYGATEDDVLAFVERARNELSMLAAVDDERERLSGAVEAATSRVRGLARRVTRARTEAAPRLADAIALELRDLGMPDAGVAIDVMPTPEIGSQGGERAAFRLSAGAGQAALPLEKVASGGELSRMMLACRSVLADLDDVPTLVFDEVDAGIGGLAGVAVGRRLAALARHRQVLVVTHLPQIASFADRHVQVDKRAGTAALTVLDDAGRVAELTRMLSGLPRSEAATTHAEELLAEAGRAKPPR
jgi:DNA repair protein RecN (Recombination protein N)